MAQVGIRVQGLNDFVRLLREVDKELPKEVRKGFNQVAEVVATDARARVPVRSGALRASIRVSSTQREARITMGSAKVPYAGWMEFGGTLAHPKRGTEQRRPIVRRGRYLYGSYFAHRDLVGRKAEEVLSTLATKAGLV